MKLDQIHPEELLGGRLDQHNLVELLGLLFVTEKSGELAVVRGKQKVHLYLFNGIPVNAWSPNLQDSLLDLVSKEKRLSPEDALQVRQLAKEKKLDLLGCLRYLYEVTDSQLYYYELKNIKELILEACCFQDGSYQFTESLEFFDKLQMFDMNPLELIYEGMNRSHFADLVEQIHALSNRKIVLNPGLKEHHLLPGPLYRHSHLLDLFASRVRVERAVAILQHELKDINLALNALAFLLITRLVIFESEMPAEEIIEDIKPPPAGPRTEPKSEAANKKRRPKPEKKKDEASEPEPPTPPPDEEFSTDYIITRPRKAGAQKERPRAETEPATPQTETERKAAPPPVTEKTPPPEPPAEPKPVPAGKPDPTASAPGPELNRLKKELSKWSEEIKLALTHYEILGITVEEDMNEIQEAYCDKKAELEEKNLPPDLSADIKAQADSILEGLEEAFTILIDPEKRVEYERFLAEDEKKRAYKMEFKKVIAQRMSQRGDWYLRHNTPAFAAEFYEKALELDAKQPEHYLNFGWALFRARTGPIEEAKGYLKSALQINPRLAKAHYCLGLIAKQEDNDQEAEACFRRAVDLDPENKPARRELSFITQRQKQKGFWQKIFGGKQ